MTYCERKQNAILTGLLFFTVAAAGTQFHTFTLSIPAEKEHFPAVTLNLTFDLYIGT